MQGMSPRILEPLRSLYKNLERRFKFGGGVGRAFGSSNGIVQGCPLSVVLLNVLMNVWATAVKSRVPGVQSACFADDAGALSSNPERLQQVLEITGSFAQVTRQKLNPGKCKCWRTCSGDSSLHLNLLGSELAQVDNIRCLGAHLAVKGNVRNDVGEKRFRRGAEIARRIQWAPLPMHVRAQLVASLVCPLSLYGIAAASVPVALVNHLRAAVMDAVWGSTRKLRCREIVMTLFVPGHRVDPEMASMYQCLCALRRFLVRRSHLQHVVHEVWAFLRGAHVPQAHSHGPIHIVLKTLNSLGWSWDEPDKLARPGLPPLPLVGCDSVWWEHQVRDGLRVMLWKRAGHRRADMQGLENECGVDRLATMKASSSVTTGRYDAGIMRSIISGSVRLQQRLHVAGLVPSPVCPFCGLGDETLEHCFWRCPCWNHVRERFATPAMHIIDQWPRCTRDCAIFMEQRAVIDLGLELEHEEAMATSLIDACSTGGVPEGGSYAGELRNEEGHVIVWTDGASRNNQDARVRRAGCGIYYAENHVSNTGCLLPGRVQTNQRAELLAIVLALRRDARGLELRTDSQYVYDGACAWSSWREGVRSGSNSDLWQLFSVAMAGRQPGSTQFTKVKGHARNIDVHRGYVLECDKIGNDGADRYACIGADMHAVPEGILQSVTMQKHRAASVQSMMVEILCARRVFLNAHAGNGDDDAIETAHEFAEVDGEPLIIPSASVGAVVPSAPVGAVT